MCSRCFSASTAEKGILCGAAIALVTDWRVFAIAMPVFILLFFATRLVSLASLTAVACFGVLYAVFYPARPEIWIITICEAAFAFIMHRGNIVRLLHGQERKTLFPSCKKRKKRVIFYENSGSRKRRLGERLWRCRFCITATT